MTSELQIPGADVPTVTSNTQLDQWPTPYWLARWLVDWAQIEDGSVILEPGAGYGNIVRACPVSCTPVAVELDPRYEPYLRAAHPKAVVAIGDYLQWQPPDWWNADRAVGLGNTPYSKPVRNVGSLFIQKTLTLTKRAVFLTYATVFHTAIRHEHIWQRAVLDRVCHLIDRPRFDDGTGTSPKTDYVVIELHSNKGWIGQPSQAVHSWVHTEELKEVYA